MKTILCIILCVLALSTITLAESKYDVILKKMNTIASQSSQYAQLIDIGQNDQSNTIYGLKIENPNYVAEDGIKVNHLLVSVHHGNEGTTADLAILFSELLIAILQNSSHAQYKALSSSVFYVIPVLNISGYNVNRRTETGSGGSTYDPNRQYPDPCDKNEYFGLASTTHLANFVREHQIVAAVTAHGYIGTFTYPWGIYTSNTKTLDDAAFKELASQSVLGTNSYRIGTHADVIYPASGAFEDWAYHELGIWCMLLEQKSSPNNQKDAECLLKFFALSPRTISSQHAHNPNNCRAIRETPQSRP